MAEQYRPGPEPTTEYLIAVDEFMVCYFEEDLGPDLEDGPRPSAHLSPFEDYTATVRGLLLALEARLAVLRALQRGDLAGLGVASLVAELREADDRVKGWGARVNAAAHRYRSNPRERPGVWYRAALLEFIRGLKGGGGDDGLWTRAERGGVVERRDGTFRFRRVGEELKIVGEEGGKSKLIGRRTFLRWASKETAPVEGLVGSSGTPTPQRSRRLASFDEAAARAKELAKSRHVRSPR